MYLIAGLGNPGKEYAGTRHNIGFAAILRLCDEYRLTLDQKKLKGIYAQGMIGTEKVILVQPQTFMNLSGECIRAIADFYKIERDHIIILYDDISLPVGKLRIRAKGSAGGHNGMKSIIAHLGSDEFMRIRVGIGEKPAGWELADYVLGRFSREESSVMSETLDQAVQAVELILREGVEKAMNRFN